MKKYQIDKVLMRLTRDMSGYTAFAFDLFLDEKIVNTHIISDCSHRKACEKMQTIIAKKYENDRTRHTPLLPPR